MHCRLMTTLKIFHNLIQMSVHYVVLLIVLLVVAPFHLDSLLTLTRYSVAKSCSCSFNSSTSFICCFFTSLSLLIDHFLFPDFIRNSSLSLLSGLGIVFPQLCFVIVVAIMLNQVGNYFLYFNRTTRDYFVLLLYS